MDLGSEMLHNLNYYGNFILDIQQSFEFSGQSHGNIIAYFVPS
jgi:hypothetical protein